MISPLAAAVVAVAWLAVLTSGSLIQRPYNITTLPPTLQSAETRKEGRDAVLSPTEVRIPSMRSVLATYDRSPLILSVGESYRLTRGAS